METPKVIPSQKYQPSVDLSYLRDIQEQKRLEKIAKEVQLL